MVQSIANRSNFRGIKIRLVWTDLLTNLRIHMKMCVPNFIGGKKTTPDSYLLELEDINFRVQIDKELRFYKQLQHILDFEI